MRTLVFLVFCLLVAFALCSQQGGQQVGKIGDEGNGGSGNAIATVLEYDVDEVFEEEEEALAYIEAATTTTPAVVDDVVRVEKTANLAFNKATHCATHCSLVQNPDQIGTPYCTGCTAGYYVYPKPANGRCFTIADALINVTMFEALKTSCMQVCTCNSKVSELLETKPQDIPLYQEFDTIAQVGAGVQGSVPVTSYKHEANKKQEFVRKCNRKGRRGWKGKARLFGAGEGHNRKKGKRGGKGGKGGKKNK